MNYVEAFSKFVGILIFGEGILVAVKGYVLVSIMSMLLGLGCICYGSYTYFKQEKQRKENAYE